MKPHNWIKSTLGHSNKICSRCHITDLEADALVNDHCDAPMEEDEKYTSPLRELATQLRATAKAHPSYSQVCELMNVVESHIHAMARCEEVNRNHKGLV